MEDQDSIAEFIKADLKRKAQETPEGEKPAEKREPRVLSAAEKKKRVKVKCVTENRPWTSEEKCLEAWKTYEIPYPDAVALEANNHVVILNPSEEK